MKNGTKLTRIDGREFVYVGRIPNKQRPHVVYDIGRQDLHALQDDFRIDGCPEWEFTISCDIKTLDHPATAHA